MKERYWIQSNEGVDDRRGENGRKDGTKEQRYRKVKKVEASAINSRVRRVYPQLGQGGFRDHGGEHRLGKDCDPYDQRLLTNSQLSSPGEVKTSEPIPQVNLEVSTSC